MRKLIFTLAVIFCVATVSAQESKMWVGGTVGLWSSKVKDGDSELSFKLAPEVGYILNEDIAIGVRIGGQHASAANLLGDDDFVGSANAYIVNPFVRYSFLKGAMGAMFVDAGIAWNHINVCGGEKNNVDMYEFGFRPGLAVNVSEKVALIGKFGFLGYQHSKAEGYKHNGFGFDFDMDNIELGMCIKF